MLLKVPDLDFSDTIQPVCLPTLDTFNPLDFDLGFFGYGRKHNEKTSKKFIFLSFFYFRFIFCWVAQKMFVILLQTFT